MVIVYWLLSPFATTFLRSGQAENFVRPENKFLVPCAQNPSFLLTMQRYEIFKYKTRLFQVLFWFISNVKM